MTLPSVVWIVLAFPLNGAPAAHALSTAYPTAAACRAAPKSLPIEYGWVCKPRTVWEKKR